MSTDNIITKDEAIDRMKAGLPCETRRTYQTEFVWVPTVWAHFDYADGEVVFRKPPEPRRAAREWWINSVGVCSPHPYKGAVHVREVLPGDVVLQRMTEDEISDAWHSFCQKNGWRAENNRQGWIEFARVLGIIGEGS